MVIKIKIRSNCRTFNNTLSKEFDKEWKTCYSLLVFLPVYPSYSHFSYSNIILLYYTWYIIFKAYFILCVQNVASRFKPAFQPKERLLIFFLPFEAFEFDFFLSFSNEITLKEEKKKETIENFVSETKRE